MELLCSPTARDDRPMKICQNDARNSGYENDVTDSCCHDDATDTIDDVRNACDFDDVNNSCVHVDDIRLKESAQPDDVVSSINLLDHAKNIRENFIIGNETEMANSNSNSSEMKKENSAARNANGCEKGYESWAHGKGIGAQPVAWLVPRLVVEDSSEGNIRRIDAAADNLHCFL